MSAEEELYGLACQDMPVAGYEVRAAMDAWEKAIRLTVLDACRDAVEEIVPAAYVDLNEAINRKLEQMKEAT